MPTLTIDLELPEAEYRFASALTQAERRRVASIAVTAAFATARIIPPDKDEDEDESWKTAPSTREDIESLAIAIAQQDAGEGYDGDVFFERLYKKKGWTLKPRTRLRRNWGSPTFLLSRAAVLSRLSHPPRPLSHRNERGGVLGSGAIPLVGRFGKRGDVPPRDSPSFILMREGAGG